jgi:CubicO group peptidase (beta-lactamase class C family)
MNRILMLVAIFTIIGLASGICTVSAFQAEPDLVAEKVDQLFSPWNKPDSPGAVVAVVKDGAVVLERGFGMANLEYDIPITPATVFDIASVSKQFTGMAIAMLAVQGKLSLDDDIRKHLPDVPDFGKTITIRHLVHHTSGIRDWPRIFGVAGRRWEDVISFEDILMMVRHQRELNFEPGAEHLYTNTGYNLLAQIVAKVSGLSFSEWTRKNIFEPLGMHDTHFHDDHSAIVKNRACSYAPGAPGQFKNVGNDLTAVGSSSLYTTVEDLVKWVLNFEHGKVGGPEVIERVHRQGVLNSGKTVDYAFGVSMAEYRGLKRVAHSGGWAGFRAYLARFPDQRFAVIVLSNLRTFTPGEKAMQIANLYLAEHFEKKEVIVQVTGEKTVVDGRTAREPSDERAFTVDPDLLEAYEGTYQLRRGWLITITEEHGRLMTQATNEARFEMTPVSEHKFFVKAYGTHILFQQDEEGEFSRLLYREIKAKRRNCLNM